MDLDDVPRCTWRPQECDQPARYEPIWAVEAVLPGFLWTEGDILCPRHYRLLVLLSERYGALSGPPGRRTGTVVRRPGA